MTKVSRELQLLRVQFSQEVGALRLEEFTQPDGDKVSVNPAEVASLEEIGPPTNRRTRITLVNGRNHTVTETYEDVKLALEG